MPDTISDEQIIEAMSHAMAEADRVWFWKDGYPDQERIKAFYNQAARRHLAAHRMMISFERGAKLK